ncbi:MAG: M20/M25/M40 family metallo-hydrolase [Woeseiaceae bacterium]|jgi:acetylornithine deacetylase/succinyl-diaminopimelate desuccinylase-like protein|nr:M20/M25/M40 family metallo-hydrolase [Woeseiaceae bacterium]
MPGVTTTKYCLLVFFSFTVSAVSAADAQQQVENLLDNPVIQEAMGDIVASDAQLLNETIELTEIPAPPFAEEKRAQRFAEKLREAGLTDVSIDEEGNVIGRRPGRSGNRTVVLSAHLDTVFPIETDVTVKVEGDTLFAPGVGDNTRGLVVVLAILRTMQQHDIATDADVLFVGNVGEEGLGDLRGVKYLFREGGPRIDAMIAVDGGKTSRLVFGGVGSHRYRVTYKGPGGHSWGAFGRASPHHAMGRAISEFIENAVEVTASGDKTTFNVGRIGGGTSVNSIAFESWMEVDLRSGNQTKLDAIDAVLKRAVQKALQDENAAREEGAELTVDVDRIGTRPAARSDIESPLVQTAAAVMNALGVEPDLQISSTDANHPISIGIPAITLSRGGIGANAHALNESWINKDAHLAIHIALITLLVEAGAIF